MPILLENQAIVVPVVRSTFLKEAVTRNALAGFIRNSTQLSMGTKCFEFERAFAQWQGRGHAILFNSGSSANLALMRSLANLSIINPGDKIGFSALTWATNVMPILQVGCRPAAVDCTPRTLNVSSETLNSLIGKKKVSAFFVTNALGLAGDLDKITAICKENNIVLLEDNCESLGTRLHSGRTGNFGLASTFSFYVAHHLSTIEGGMVCTDDDKLADMLTLVRSHGWDRNLSSKSRSELRKAHKVESDLDSKYIFYDLAYNFRPTEITGFLGCNQLKYLGKCISERERIFFSFETALKDNIDFIPLNHEHIVLLSSFCLPVVCRTARLKRKYQERFLNAGIEIRPMIAGNIQRQPFFKKYADRDAFLPGAEFLHENSFYCGNYPDMPPEHLDRIIECLKPL